MPVDPLCARLRRDLPADIVLDDLAARLQWAGDASVYRLIPRVVLLARSVDDVRVALAHAAEADVPCCFRAGGTSLSGQAVSDGLLIVISRLRGIRVLDGGARVACQPGAVGSWVNAALAPHGRRIGPDPASIQAAEIGGIVANNASGMCCGVAENSYRTVERLELVLADGWSVDTGAADADERMARERPALHRGLAELRDALRADLELAERVRRAFATKNTVGYSLNAFLDAETPARILQRLVVGSEGTLAFIGEATFRTLPLPRHRATAWLLFADVESAARAVPPLAAAGAAAIEILDDVALRRVAHKLPDPLPVGEPAALLVEFQEEHADVLAYRLAATAPALAACATLTPAAFTRDAATQARYWAIRKGLFPSVGAVRAAGTAVVIEDITFPVEALAAGMRELRALFTAHGYADAVVFGHAKDGNLHFTLTPDFAQPAEVQRYDRFMRALVELVIARGGNLKAEHGTGRNMAPFVRAQWGDAAVAIMRRVKALLDPRGLLNPGVLLDDDPQAHLKHLKTMPPTDELVDRCIECGFCEPTCPSRDLATSPRQRIALLRQARGGDRAASAAIGRMWQAEALDTCAADGTCAIACPVAIDTGALVKAERAMRRTPLQRRIALAIADRLGTAVGATRVALGWARRLTDGRVPGSAVPLPPPARDLPRTWPRAKPGQPTFVYLPTCLARSMGADPLPHLLSTLCTRAGVGLVVPPGVSGLCCAQPFASKGFPDAERRMAAKLVRAFGASGEIAIVTDTSTCAGHLDHLHEVLRKSGLRAGAVYDPARFAAEILVPRLSMRRRLPALALHPTCSEQRHGWTGHLAKAAGACADAHLPSSAACCGMAGDKGWSLPGLTLRAAAREGREARALAGDGAATSATCGLALGAASGVRYRHLWSWLEIASR
ncbi:MAG TPA: FAD-binding and (Fe-S)-binding domain-containing protein [Planctomycetota bacterium]|nr:FAD-binding and (Fe-S)-binding domain-containing protein [Planctomycetota bacterium]